MVIQEVKPAPEVLNIVVAVKQELVEADVDMDKDSSIYNNSLDEIKLVSSFEHFMHHNSKISEKILIEYLLSQTQITEKEFMTYLLGQEPKMV